MNTLHPGPTSYLVTAPVDIELGIKSNWFIFSTLQAACQKRLFQRWKTAQTIRKLNQMNSILV